jgi:hypothetical protein
MSILGFTPPAGWGNRSQLGFAVQALKDLEGNRDRMILNEDRAPGVAKIGSNQNPLALRIKLSNALGFSPRDEVALLQRYREYVEEKFGEVVIAPEVQAQLKHGELYAALKAIDLVALGRRPNEVRDGFLSAKGSVDGVEIAPRKLHYQHFAPIGEAKGQVVVVSPGFLESGVSFYELTQALNKEGYDVVLGDHQWAGQSEGKAGGIDRGLGVARDAAAFGAYGARLAKELYGDRGQVLLFGNSMGAGPGVTMALSYADHGRLKLEGDELPKGLPYVVTGAFYGPSDNAANRILGFLGEVPAINRMPLPAFGQPVLTKSPIGGHLGAQSAVRIDARAQGQANAAALPDLERFFGELAKGLRPLGAGAMLHSAQDSLADPGLANKVAGHFGIELQSLAGSDHVIQQSPAAIPKIVQAIEETFARSKR